MSVVIGLIKDNIVTVATDKRKINLRTGKVLSDNNCKLFKYGSNIAIAVSGNAGMCELLLYYLNIVHQNSSANDFQRMTTTAMTSILENLIEEIRHHELYSSQYPLNIMLAGKSISGKPEIKVTNNIVSPEWEISPQPDPGLWRPRIFEPKELTNQQCIQIVSNVITADYYANPEKIAQEAIKQISTYAQSVSPNSDCWTVIL